MSQIRGRKRIRDVDSTIALAAGSEAGQSRDFEAIFAAHYARVARVIARVIRDPARAEELAVEVFLKWRKLADPTPATAEAWLCTTAVRIAIDELRSQDRRAQLLRFLPFRRTPTPEETHATNEEQQLVRAVLRHLPSRQAELLTLRHEGLSYEELAQAIEVNPASVGTLLSRAQAAFRKEYIERYGSRK